MWPCDKFLFWVFALYLLISTAVTITSMVLQDQDFVRIMVIVSGVTINLGTLIQVVTMWLKRDINLSHLYITGLVIGCCQLLSLQVFILVNSPDGDTMTSTVISTACSLACAALLLLTLTCQRRKGRKEKCLIFVEGTSGIGKTTVSDASIDFTRMCQICPAYKDKESSTAFASAYTLDTMLLLNEYAVKLGKRSLHVVIDRSPLSQILYGLLFSCDGGNASPGKFMADFTEKFDILAPRLIKVYKNMINSFNELGYDSVRIVWAVAANVEHTVRVLTKRNGFEVGLNCRNYVINQNYAFKKMALLLDNELLQCHTFITRRQLFRRELLSDILNGDVF